MRSDVDPRAVAVHMTNWLFDIDDAAAVKGIMLKQLRADAEKVLSGMPAHACEPSEAERLRELVAEGYPGIVFKGGEIYVAA